MIIQGNNPEIFYNTININGTLWLDKHLYAEVYRNGESPNHTDGFIPVLQQVPLTIGEELLDPDIDQIAPIIWANNWYSGMQVSLFNHKVVEDSRNIAPLGCRIATYEDYQKLFQFLGENIGSKLKSSSESPDIPSYWLNPSGNIDSFAMGFYMTGYLHLKNNVWGYYDSEWQNTTPDKQSAYIWTGTPGPYGDPSALRLLGNSTGAALVTVSNTAYLPIRCVVETSDSDPLFYGV